MLIWATTSVAENQDWILGRWEGTRRMYWTQHGRKGQIGATEPVGTTITAEDGSFVATTDQGEKRQVRVVDDHTVVTTGTAGERTYQRKGNTLSTTFSTTLKNGNPGEVEIMLQKK
jgi:hypothetical protein